MSKKSSPSTTREAEREPRPPERRLRLRHLGKAETLVLRDSDTMRAGLGVRLQTIRAGSLVVISPVPLRLNEQVKIRLRNDVQRITAELRGAVRWFETCDDGSYLIEFDLFTRLMPLDVMALRRAGATDILHGEKIWV
ncbi:MAG TPA: hypothetical protein VL475_05395 [Planctomycetaceae bacterium]|jgi:hypothetical protein|nr:hypothetical protein [Planctomycetaceae bacterium]